MVYCYYIQLSKPILWSANIIQAELKDQGQLLTCRGCFSDRDIDKYKLIYIGRGRKTDKHIQERLMIYGG